MNSKKARLLSPEKTTYHSEHFSQEIIRDMNSCDILLALHQIPQQQPQVVLKNMCHLKLGSTYKLRNGKWVPVSTSKNRRQTKSSKSTSFKRRSRKPKIVPADVCVSDCSNLSKLNAKHATAENSQFSEPKIASRQYMQSSELQSRIPEPYINDQILHSESQLKIETLSVESSQFSEQETSLELNGNSSEQQNSMIHVESDFLSQISQNLPKPTTEEIFYQTSPYAGKDSSLQRSTRKSSNDHRNKRKSLPSESFKIPECSFSPSFSGSSSQILQSLPQQSCSQPNMSNLGSSQHSLSDPSSFLSKPSSEIPSSPNPVPSRLKSSDESEDELVTLRMWMKKTEHEYLQDDYPKDNPKRRNDNIKTLAKRLKCVQAEKSHYQKITCRLEKQRSENKNAKMKATTDLEQFKSEIDPQLKRLKMKIDKLKKENELKKLYSEKLEKKLQQEKQRNDKMAKDMEKLTSINNNLEKQLKQGYQQEAAMLKMNNENKTLNQQCRCFRVELQKKTTQIDELTSEQRKLSNHNKELLEKMVALQCEVEIVKEHCSQSKENIHLTSQIELEKEELPNRSDESLYKIDTIHQKKISDIKIIDKISTSTNQTTEASSHNPSQSDELHQEIVQLKKKLSHLEKARDVANRKNGRLERIIKTLQLEKSSLIKECSETKKSLKKILLEKSDSKSDNVKENSYSLKSQLQEKMAEVVKVQQKLQISKQSLLKEKQQLELEKKNFQEEIAKFKSSKALQMKVQDEQLQTLINLRLHSSEMTAEEIKTFYKTLFHQPQTMQMDVSTQVEKLDYSYQKRTNKNVSTQIPSITKPKWNLYEITNCRKAYAVQDINRKQSLDLKHSKKLQISETNFKSLEDQQKAQKETNNDANTLKSRYFTSSHDELLKIKFPDRKIKSDKTSTVTRQRFEELEGEFFNMKSWNSVLEEENSEINNKIEAFERVIETKNEEILKLLKNNNKFVSCIRMVKTNFMNLQKIFESWRRYQVQGNKKGQKDSLQEEMDECNLARLMENYNNLKADCDKLRENYSDLQIKHSHLYKEIARLRSRSE